MDNPKLYLKWIPSILVVLLTTGCFNMNKYEWDATESAAKGYPIQIAKGSFIFPEGGGLSIPKKRFGIQSGWGWSISAHVVGERYKPLPNKIEFTYFSYTEDKFYQGSLDLPYDKIVRLFSEGYYSFKRDKHDTYSSIMAGFAPGGTVAVWLLGADKITEVFFGKGEEVDAPWELISSNPRYTRDETLQTRLLNYIGEEGIANLKKNGIPFDKWANYRKRYKWFPRFYGNAEPPLMINEINYFNGEKDYEFYPLTAEAKEKERPIPSSLYILWGEKREVLTYKLEVFFDEEEIMNVFKQQLLYTEDGLQDGAIELQILANKNAKGRYIFSVHIGTKKASIQLKKVKFKRV